MNKFYITSAIPYVNAKPHIGWTTEIIEADTLARYHKILGDRVLFLCGSDENALKNLQAAEQAHIPVQSFVDTNAKAFQELAEVLNIHLDVFQKGSSEKHHKSSQTLWKLCEKAGDIYKKSYKGLYCVGCELFYTKGELDEKGECYEHPGKKLEEVEEENYFFHLSKYQNKLRELLTNGTYQIVPEYRKQEMLSFIDTGLQDFSISRSNTRARNWGVPVPNDPSQRIYVWFDALNIYQSGIGFGWDEKQYNTWWPADLHVIGKGIIRFHAIYWPAILLSAGLPLPKKLFVHEYLTVNGQKISKSLGNAIDPLPLAKQFGTDALRYYLLAKASPFSDSDFTVEKLKESYNSDLANGLGNLVARVAKLCEQKGFSIKNLRENRPNRILDEITPLIEQFKFNDALSHIWGAISGLDSYINKKRPWQQELSEANKTLSNIIIGSEALTSLLEIAEALKPFLPDTAKKIQEQFKGPKITSQKPLFPRI